MFLTSARRFIDDPVAFKRVNGCLAVLWALSIPPSVLLGLLSLVEYISALSIYAVVMGHLSTYAAARVEVKQDGEEGSGA